MREYGYSAETIAPSHDYLGPAVLDLLGQIRPHRVLDLGCGEGSMTARFATPDTAVVGIDASTSGVAIARHNHPQIQFEVASVYDDLPERFGRFSMVISLEVVEHLYDPRTFAKNIFDLLEPGGTAVLSTPYHGYIKNVVMAVTGRMDKHFTALWDNGHIKFWSIETLSRLLLECGFEQPRFVRVGRIAPLAKSMIAIARRPSA